ncbi:Inorganic phosphate transport PHO88 [Mycena indigotica]|uniref:Inorganic phosphate transport PHO88 n=1 Tax=Mycena indigotica TaxID=2126181 RepID=A0A8H6T526_9AGAR|nr:Inorganic phosphate transport PHO88 [Mycena indigotica]KAF7309565.1 Inorganic phosphate transport PHO88 [Mycena indigotica]
MNPAVSNLVISLAVMQLARKIPFEDPEVLYYVRVGYVSMQILVLSVYYYISMTIKSKNDQTVLKYVEAPNPMSQEPGQLVNTTVRDYDLLETSKLLRSVYMGMAMMGFMHGYMKFTQPLFVQAIMAIKSLYDATPFKIHILGQKAEGDLKRPWKTAGGMFGAAGGPQTDNAAITEAEKRVGGTTSKKEE